MFACYQTLSTKKKTAPVRKTATVHHCELSFIVAAGSSRSTHCKMGNTNTACQVTNYSKRNVRVFVTEKALEIDAILTSESKDDEHGSSVLSTDKKFSFGKNTDCIRVLASQTQEVKWEPQHFVSIFVEDEDDENICSKQIIHNMVPSSPVTVLLYDV